MDLCPRWDADSIFPRYLNLSQSLFLNFNSLWSARRGRKKVRGGGGEEERITIPRSIPSTGEAITHTVIFELGV